jgi:membrane fusion protein (multidrug efflux system)
LISAVLLIAGALVAWKVSAIAGANAASAHQPEPMESVAAATAREREHRDVTTSIGTVLALRSVTLRNEVAGTVRQVMLEPGAMVDAGRVLVALDVSVEEAELEAEEAQAKLAETALARIERLSAERAAPQAELDRATAQRDVALAQIARTKAVIARKTIRAPFTARVGIADVHPGQYLAEGTLLTTLQGVDPAAHVDFTVAQQVAATLREGDQVEILASGDSEPVPARIVAIDARIDPATRNATVRARTVASRLIPAPGASVRVIVPVGAARRVVTIPVSALRKGPQGDHVFVVAPGPDGRPRAHTRPVESGPVLGDEVVILAGLSVGEKVAAAGSFKLREGVLVAIAADSAAAPGASN